MTVSVTLLASRSKDGFASFSVDMGVGFIDGLSAGTGHLASTPVQDGSSSESESVSSDGPFLKTRSKLPMWLHVCALL